MSSDTEIGLSPNRAQLKEAIKRHGIVLDQDFEKILDALDYIKLTREDSTTSDNNTKVFTFSHRRFQEYFSTSFLLKNQQFIDPYQLLSNARWREAAVVIFQTQNTSLLSALIDEIRKMLLSFNGELTELIDDPLRYITESEIYDDDKTKVSAFHWPTGLIHLLSLIQDGFGNHINDLPFDIRLSIGKIVLSASEIGILTDQKWSLEVAGVSPQPILVYLLRNALNKNSQWLKNTAYTQFTRIKDIPADIALWIRSSFIQLFTLKLLYKERFTTRSFILRLSKPDKFLSILDLLLYMKRYSYFMHILFGAYLIYHSYIFPVSIFEKINFLPQFARNFLSSSYLSPIAISCILYLSYKFNDLFSISFFDINAPMIPLTMVFMIIRLMIIASSSIFISNVNMVLFVCGCIYISSWSMFASLAAWHGIYVKKIFWPVIQTVVSIYIRHS